MFKKVFTCTASSKGNTPELSSNKFSDYEIPGTTVISEDVSLEGNLNVSGMLIVHGEIRGDIEANQGTVNVMRTGKILGNITSHELIIDGTIEGECTANTVNLEENGSLHGRLNYAILCVKNGGMIAGHINQIPAQEKPVILTSVVAKIELTPTSEQVLHPIDSEKSSASKRKK